MNAYVLKRDGTYVGENAQLQPIKVANATMAKQFPSLKDANNYLHSQDMRGFNKRFGEFTPVDSGEEYIENGSSRKNTAFENNILKEIGDLSGTTDEFDIKLSDRDNKYAYSGQTFLETIPNVPQAIEFAIRVLSDLDTFIANMQYLEREWDMKILDIRHHLRNKDNKFDAVTMAQIGYLEQDYERSRFEVKRNRIIASIMAADYDRFKDERMINVVKRVGESEYRSRRLSLDDLKKEIADRRSNPKVVSLKERQVG